MLHFGNSLWYIDGKTWALSSRCTSLLCCEYSVENVGDKGALLGLLEGRQHDAVEVRVRRNRRSL